MAASSFTRFPFSCVLVKTCQRLCSCQQPQSRTYCVLRPHQGKFQPPKQLSCGLERYRHFSTQAVSGRWTQSVSSAVSQQRPKFSVTSVPVMSNEEALPREVKQGMSIGEMEGWVNVGPYSIFAWSVSGVESCIVVKSDDVYLAFDMGIAVPESVKAANVFITHGHIDHIGAVTSHVAKRSLNGQKPARYYVAPHLVDNLLAVTRAHHAMAETVEALENVRVMPIQQGDLVRLNKQYFVKAFPTTHRIPSQGYILYREERTLKAQYRGMEGFDVAALHRQGTEIHDVVVTPEVAYTGDTVFDVFVNPPTPDLLKVKLLITEATFLDDDLGHSVVQKARDRGHTHLSEFCQRPELFQDVGHILLVHFSNRYPCKYIVDTVRDKLPPQLRAKVTPATVAKATSSVTYAARQ